MIQNMLKGVYPSFKLYHLRMAFSAEMDQVGRFQLKKVFHLLWLIFATYRLRLNEKIRILYFPPAGPDLIPVLRDIVFLIATRWLFDNVLFHFHASGVSDFYNRRSRFMQRLMRIAYFDADAAIYPSTHGIEDAQAFRAKTEFMIPFGIEDLTSETSQGSVEPRKRQQPTVLFVGVLREDKGVLVLLEAAHLLERRGYGLNWVLVGKFVSSPFERQVRQYVELNGLSQHVRFTGVATGAEKAHLFSAADIFCFPTYFGSESFPVAVIEALCFGLPVVATHWRGVPDVVEDEKNGLLVPIKNSEALANSLQRLLDEPDLRQRMGRAGRRKFEGEFTEDRYRRRLEDVFRAVSQPRPQGTE